MQKLTVTGRIGRDAQEKVSGNGGNPFVTFSLATNSKYKGEEKTTWYEIIMFPANRNKGIIPYLKKGKGVVVIGELDLSTYEAQDGSTRLRAQVIADSIDFWGDGGQKSEDDSQQKPAAAKTETPPSDSKPAPSLKAPKAASKEAPKVEEEISMRSDDTNDDDDLPF